MTTSHVVQAMQLGLDLRGKPRGLFLYDGGCGVCKFTVSIISHYDTYDHLRYRPLQTTFLDGSDDEQMKELYLELGIPPFDLSTAVLLEGTKNRIYIKSDAILYCLYHMGFPFTIIGTILILLIPKMVRDFGYALFAKNRSQIWITIKKITGLPDTSLYGYRQKILLPKQYIENPSLIPPSWGLIEQSQAASSSSSSSSTATMESKSSRSTIISEESKKDS